MKGIRGYIYKATGQKSNLDFKPGGQRHGVKSMVAMRDLDKLPVRLRPAEPEDAPLIYDTWLKSHAGQNKDQPKWAVYPLHKKIVKRLLKDAITIVAAGNTTESQNDIYSWMCAERTKNFFVMHYAFTKQIFRTRGLFKSLLGAFEYKPGEPIICSHRGWVLKELKGKYNFRHIPHLQFDWGMSELEKIYEIRIKSGNTKQER
jgi:hypothetical protein